MLVDERIRQGSSLFEALDETEHLRARDEKPESEEAVPRAATPKVAPPPNMAALGEIARWNELS